MIMARHQSQSSRRTFDDSIAVPIQASVMVAELLPGSRCGDCLPTTTTDLHGMEEAGGGEGARSLLLLLLFLLFLLLLSPPSPPRPADLGISQAALS